LNTTNELIELYSGEMSEESWQSMQETEEKKQEEPSSKRMKPSEEVSTENSGF
jgi:hypothetical protein